MLLRLKIYFLFILLTLFSILTNCYYINIGNLDEIAEKNNNLPVGNAPKEITSFAFKVSKNPALSSDLIGTINTAAGKVSVAAPSGTKLTGLAPTIEISGASINPASGIAQDFTDGVAFPYTVTGSDGSTKNYSVTVDVALASDKDITYFAFEKASNPALPGNMVGVIGDTTVDVFVPAGTKTNGLKPTISITGSSISPASGKPQSFIDGSGVPYTVTASDSTTKVYTVTVYEPPKPGNSGKLTFSGETTNSVTVKWTKADDTITSQINLQYLVYYSKSNNIGTVENIEANGTAFGSYTANINNVTVTGLDDSTIYYFNVIVKDQNGNKSAYTMNSTETRDGKPPVLDNSGILFSGITANSITVSWATGTDNKTAIENLQYLVYYSTSNNIGTVAEAKLNGTPSGGYAANISTKTVASLADSTIYYFNVIVKDEAGNEAVYTMNSHGTGDGIPPTAGGGGAITFGAATENSITVIWTKGWDNKTTPGNLRYLVYYSTKSDNMYTAVQIASNVDATAFGVYTSDINTVNVTGLSDSTIYYFNVIVKDEAGNETAYTMNSKNTKDITPPVAGGVGAITLSGETANSVTVSWTTATDTITAQADLQYLVYYSTSGNIGTVGNITNGAPVGVYTSDINSIIVTGLSDSTIYYFNVIVKDVEENKTVYTMNSTNTLDIIPPVPGNGGIITFSGVTANSVTVNWTKATDNITAPAALQYLVYYSTVANIDVSITNGAPVGVYTSDINTRTVTGLSDSTTYYFNVIVKDEEGNEAVYTMNSQATSDGAPPVSGNGGVITFSGVTTNSVTVNWTEAVDNKTTQANLQYLVYYSTSNNIGTVENAELNGTPSGSYAANISTKTVTPLADSTTYYFNVIVKDEAGNKAVYTMNAQATPDGTPPSIADSTITIVFASPSSVYLQWGKATDNITAQANLQYLAYYSTSNNIDTVENAEANGTPSGSYAKNIYYKQVTSLHDCTTYYFNVIVKDEAGNKTAYSMVEQATPDGTPPTVADGGITVTSITDTSMTLNWTKATDNASPQSNLQYRVYYSTTGNINYNTANIEANGTPLNSYTPDINTLTVTGLMHLTLYYFNVIVKDDGGNKAVYSMKCCMTLSGVPALTPTVGPPLTGAVFDTPYRMVIAGSYIYVTDWTNHTVSRVDIATGTTAVFAGETGVSGSTDGIGAAARFTNPAGICSDGTNLYVGENGGKLRKIVIATAEVTTMANTSISMYGLATDGINIYIANYGNSKIEEYSITMGTKSTFAGSTAGYLDGIGTAAQFNYINDICTDGTYLYVTDAFNYRIRKIDLATAEVTTLAGSGTNSSVDGTGIGASFQNPKGIETDGTYVYVAQSNNRVRKIDIATGVVTTIASTLGSPVNDAATDGVKLYVIDDGNNNIQVIQ